MTNRDETRRLSIVVVLVVVLFWGGVAACTPPLSSSAVCEETAECEEDLECLPTAVWDGEECTENSKICSVSCDDDGDCEELGDDYKCFERCDEGATCARVVAE